MNTFLYSYNMKSKSAKALAEKLGIRRIKHKGSRFKAHHASEVINWGATEVPMEVGKCAIINPPDVVETTSNKLKFFQLLENTDLTLRYTPHLGNARN
ncbi:MAG: hypothetical protein ACXABY_19345, partial [Candidatus Thorarchaeota archaeon]